LPPGLNRLKFYRTPAPLTWLHSSLTWRINTPRKDIYLTFDDGPVPGPTEFVLDTLHEQGAKATFFCIGRNIAKNPAIYERIIREGHTVGNHTFDHVNGWKLPTAEYISNVHSCNALMESCTALFRPPYGKITPSAIRQLPTYKIIMWDVLSYDFAADVAPEQCLRGSLKATRPGSIIVFHDSYKAERNMRFALPRFIRDCRDRGFEFKTLAAEPRL
jgi:peptidoglycan/xylan/chitin deacetylase (PgdA/CDA1 family)